MAIESNELDMKCLELRDQYISECISLRDNGVFLGTVVPGHKGLFYRFQIQIWDRLRGMSVMWNVMYGSMTINISRHS